MNKLLTKSSSISLSINVVSTLDLKPRILI